SGLGAIVSVYVALDLTGRVAASGGVVRSAWILGGALVAGIGMWTMHFIGMLALHFPVPVTYTVKGVLLALAIAVASSILWLLVAAARAPTSLSVLVARGLPSIRIGGSHVAGI